MELDWQVESGLLSLRDAYVRAGLLTYGTDDTRKQAADGEEPAVAVTGRREEPDDDDSAVWAMLENW